jgi:hypothetical protein
MGGSYGVRFEMTLDRFMKIGSGIQVILSLLPEEYERLQCWYYWKKRFMNYAVEMALGSMIYIPSFMMIDKAILRLLEGIYKHIHCV